MVSTVYLDILINVLYYVLKKITGAFIMTYETTDKMLGKIVKYQVSWHLCTKVTDEKLR